MTHQLSCKCGQVKAALEKSKLYGHHFICMCDDCQAYIKFLDNEDEFLDANGGTDIIPISAAELKIVSGKEKLECVRLTDKGMFRWYAGCCKTPLANSMDPKVGYIGVIANTLPASEREKVLGPPKARMMAKFGKPPFPEHTYQTTPVSFMLFVLGQIVRMLVKGLRKPNPFFDEKNQPIRSPKVLNPRHKACHR